MSDKPRNIPTLRCRCGEVIWWRKVYITRKINGVVKRLRRRIPVNPGYVKQDGMTYLVFPDGHSGKVNTADSEMRGFIPHRDTCRLGIGKAERQKQVRKYHERIRNEQA